MCSACGFQKNEKLKKQCTPKTKIYQHFNGLLSPKSIYHTPAIQHIFANRKIKGTLYIYKKLGPIKGLRGKENYLKGEFICEYEFIFLIGKTNEQKDEFQRIVV